MRENIVENAFVARIKELGGEVRKVRWVGRRHAPDRVAMFRGVTAWVELKATGEKARPRQAAEHQRMRDMGQVVIVIDSLEGIDEHFPLNDAY